MFATILGPLVDRVKVLLAARAVQELEEVVSLAPLFGK